MENRTILVGDVIEQIKTIPAESIDCVITSPPYWGLRDYGVEGQWGLEPDFHEYLEKLRSLMNEIKRVLKNTGTAWINLGDTYSGGNAHSDWADTTINPPRTPEFKSIPKRHIVEKSRYGIPERFYAQCIDDGWVARNHIPWVKANSMPSSVKDRFTNKWESIFFFAKKPRYFFNLDAVREDTITESRPFNVAVRDKKRGRAEEKWGGLQRFVSEKEAEQYNDDGTRKMLDVPGQSPHGIHRNRAEGKPDWEDYGNHQPEGRSHFGTGRDIRHNMEKAAQKKQDNVPGKNAATYEGFNKRWKETQEKITGDDTKGSRRSRVIAGAADINKRKWVNQGFNKSNPHTMSGIQSGGYNMETGESLSHPKGKNPGDVFVEDLEPAKKALLEMDKVKTGGHTGIGNQDAKEEMYRKSAERGKNPGDVIYDNSKPYAVQEREGTIYYRDLPDRLELIEYLNFWRSSVQMTIDRLEEIWQNMTPHHWFDKSDFGTYPTREDWIKLKDVLGFDGKYDVQMTILYDKPAEKQNDPKGKNPGDVFFINPRPFPAAHFAVFPPQLPEKIIKCACPEYVCKKCGKPRTELVKVKTKENERDRVFRGETTEQQSGINTLSGQTYNYPEREVIGLSDCGCGAGFEPGMVLDPFLGSGTTGFVADSLGRNWVGIELKQEYVDEITKKRLDPKNNHRMDEF